MKEGRKATNERKEGRKEGRQGTKGRKEDLSESFQIPPVIRLSHEFFPHGPKAKRRGCAGGGGERARVVKNTYKYVYTYIYIHRYIYIPIYYT